MTTSYRCVEDAARDMAGNWKDFQCFSWSTARELDDADNWCVVYTNNRDSGLLDQSNADAIAKTLQPFLDSEEGDVMEEHHGHWACGWIDGYSIRVYRDGKVTPAFETWHEIQERLADYPVLNEEDYSRREYEATLENIREAYRLLRAEYALPEGWEGEAFSWFWDHNQRAVENRDDQGGYPSDEELTEAFEALGYQKLED